MNHYQEALSDKIIELHRESDGLFEWGSWYNQIYLFSSEMSDSEKQDQIGAIKVALSDLGLITFLDEEENISRLTNIGTVFSSFKDMKDKEEKETKLNNLNFEKLQLEFQELRERVFDYAKSQKQNSRLVVAVKS